MIQDTRPLIRVVAGILLDSDGNYLLSSRPEGKPYAGYWEFAGGKVEAGETDFQALQREFEEELGIRILAATPWLTKIHSYEHARVCLKFLWVNPGQWTGEPQSREGQAWSWQKAGDFTVAPHAARQRRAFAFAVRPAPFVRQPENGFARRKQYGRVPRPAFGFGRGKRCERFDGGGAMAGQTRTRRQRVDDGADPRTMAAGAGKGRGCCRVARVQ